MFRVISYQSLFRILLILSLGLTTVGASAQTKAKDQPKDPEATDNSAKDSAEAQQPATSADPLKRPPDEKQKSGTRKLLNRN